MKHRWIALMFLSLLMGGSLVARADRLLDMASIQGVRDNQLVGYGLVIGLDGTGDQTVQTPFTVQSLSDMLTRLGVNMPASSINITMLKNIAAVMVTADMPAFAQPGQKLDVTVSSLGTAKSLVGGTLVMTPLKGADGRVYAMAQGNLLVGGMGASANGTRVQVNHLTVGRITDGATVEQGVPDVIGQGGDIHVELNQTDFATAARVVDAINRHFGMPLASALDGRVIAVKSPMNANERVGFIGALQQLDVTPAQENARVIINARTGSVVMNQMVTLDPCAISHGNLTVTVSTTPQVSQPAPLSKGKTKTVATSQVSVQAEPGAVAYLKGGASLADVVHALNTVGATPQDLLAILQAMKTAGALHAELVII